MARDMGRVATNRRHLRYVVSCQWHVQHSLFWNSKDCGSFSIAVSIRVSLPRFFQGEWTGVTELFWGDVESKSTTMTNLWVLWSVQKCEIKLNEGLANLMVFVKVLFCRSPFTTFKAAAAGASTTEVRQLDKHEHGRSSWSTTHHS
jgi:hypothetical protein